jgi:tetratricopeptide (TPR) repeat protein
MWNGDFEGSREVGERLRAVADRIGNPVLAFWSEWTLAATSGLRGDTRDLHRRVEDLERIAESVHSPSLHLWAAELALEERYSAGEWEEGIGLGEQAVALARSLEIHSVLPRLLVWLSLIYIGRGDLDRAGELVDEAWETSGADGATGEGAVLNVHTVVPAHIGRTAYHLAREEWGRAIEIGRRGLAVVEEAGYVVWAVHRLLPLLTEAHLYAGNLAEAEALGRRLKAFGEATDHRLARAWGTAGEGIVSWLKGDVEAGTLVMIRAAGMLEEIPLLFDAARVRRQVAGRLFDMGRREAALAELTRVHGIFTSLGAQLELRKTLGQFAEMEAAPPPATPGPESGA